VNGTLYGTTVGGGSGFGTVFRVTTTGTEKMLYSFRGTSDGAYPYAGLLNVGGTLYGTTGGGGVSGMGTVFRVTTTGREKILHRFAGGSDGTSPTASLIEFNGKLYGTTQGGGPSGVGTVFNITTTGKENVLYSFSYNSGDGWSPASSLINVHGTFYGTTVEGGASAVGTIFSVTAAGKEEVRYSFSASPLDGGNPYASLIDVKGRLYGTTLYGGGYSCGRHRGRSCGTVFALTP
jgi:uncharacterized repeat protein (TIGR03803 family)